MKKFNNNQNNYIPKEFIPNVPKTATVAYYYPEEEITTSPLIRDGVYRSWKADADYPSYGPMPNQQQGCKQVSKFEVYMRCTGDYVLAYHEGRVFALAEVASGMVRDQDFSAIQKRIDELKSGELRVYKGNGTEHDAKRNRTNECMQYEGWFQANLENAIGDLKKHEHYGYSVRYDLKRP